MEPTVLHLIPCNDIETDSSNHHRFNIFGLITSIRSSQSPPFPVSHSNLVVLVVWMGGQGEGELVMRITDAGSQNAVFHTRSQRVRFVGNPDAIGGVAFRAQNCSFPAAGL